jgi:amino acid transporter
VSVGNLLALTSSTTAALLSQPRIFYIMAEDGLLYGCLTKMNKKGVPVNSIILTGKKFKRIILE